MKHCIRTDWSSIAAGILVALFVSACVTEKSPITGQARSYGMSWKQEQEVGRQSNAEIIQEFGLYPDPKVQAYIRQVGERVLAKSDLRKPTAPAEYRNTQFTFQALDSPEVNAFAVPGGYIYVTRGLLAHLENEAQLAVVLGHEIAHIAARHSAQQALQSQVGQIGLLGGALLGAQVMGNPEAAGQLMNLGSTALQLVTLKYSRADEAQADELGVKYASLTGYDAAQSSHFFESLKRISQREGDRLPTFLSSHPDPGGREQRVIQLAQQYRRPMQILAVNRAEYLQQVNGLVVGENPRDGFVQNNLFYHPGLGFQFPVPAGWKVQNQNAFVKLVPPQRQAALVLQPVRASSPQAAASQFAQSQGLKVLNTAPLQIGGLNAVAVTAQANTEQGLAGLVNYFIGFNGKVYSFLGISGASQLNAYAPQFQQVVAGFGQVTDPRIRNVQPARIALVTVPQPAPFSSFVPTSKVAGLAPEDIAILNQVAINQTVPAGTILKIPRGP